MAINDLISMRVRFDLAFLIPAMVAAVVSGGGAALAHSFNVALVIPLSGGAEAEDRQVLAGFMLATAERDGHPDQESDGHLGGLDVYVSVIDGSGDIANAVRYAARRGRADIFVVFGPESTRSLVGELLKNTGAVLLPPVQSPFSNPEAPGVAAFISAYEREHGARPSTGAARGYNAARRIAAAVRAQGGAGDKGTLRSHFLKSARDFTW